MKRSSRWVVFHLHKYYANSWHIRMRAQNTLLSLLFTKNYTSLVCLFFFNFFRCLQIAYTIFIYTISNLKQYEVSKKWDFARFYYKQSQDFKIINLFSKINSKISWLAYWSQLKLSRGCFKLSFFFHKVRNWTYFFFGNHTRPSEAILTRLKFPEAISRFYFFS